MLGWTRAFVRDDWLYHPDPWSWTSNDRTRRSWHRNRSYPRRRLMKAACSGVEPTLVLRLKLELLCWGFRWTRRREKGFGWPRFIFKVNLLLVAKITGSLLEVMKDLLPWRKGLSETKMICCKKWFHYKNVSFLISIGIILTQQRTEFFILSTKYYKLWFENSLTSLNVLALDLKM